MSIKINITEVKVFPVQGNGILKAFATMVFNDCFIVRDLKIIKGIKGLFVSMPSRRRKEGFRDIVHPLNSETRKIIEDTILQEYKRMEAEGFVNAESDED